MNDRATLIPFARPDSGEDEIAVLEALRSGRLTTGSTGAAFEREIAEFIGGGSHAFAVNSASAGLHLAVEGLGNGEVNVPFEDCSVQAACFIVATHQEHEPGPGIRG